MIKYSTILHDVRERLKLSMNEYAVADSIHKLSELPNYNWKANRTYISDFLVIDRTNVIKIIERLINIWILQEWWNYVTDLWKNEVLWNTTVTDVNYNTNCSELPHNNNYILNNNNPPVIPQGEIEEKTPKEKKYKLSLSLEEIITIWNSVEDKYWIKFKAPPSTNIYKQLLSSYNAKRDIITDDEFYKWLDNYLLEISKRKEWNSYYTHRFALHLFMKQNNGLESFIYNY